MTEHDLDLGLLTDTIRKSMATTSGADLDKALAELGWADMLTEIPEIAIPLVFRSLGETGAHAAVLNDVIAAEAGLPTGDTPALPYAGRSWVVWDRADVSSSTCLDPELPVRQVDSGGVVPVAAGRRALAWWLVGTSRTMLGLARSHALDRTQFGKPIAGFQAVRHRLAETLVAIEGAEAALAVADDDLGALLGKAAAGRAAIIAARNCQQVLAGIGFTAEHPLQGHIRRALFLDGLLGSTRELTREAGAIIRTQGTAPRLVQL